MADTQAMVKDLISTVEEKVNKPLAQSTGALTGEFYSDPGSTRQRIVNENAANPLNPLQIDALVGQRRGSIASQISGNNSLASSNAGILNNYFDLINQQAQRASDAAYRNSQSKQTSYQHVTDDQGNILVFDPSTGTFKQGVAASDTGGDAEAQRYADLIGQGYFSNPKTGYIDVSKIPAKYRDRALQIYESRQGQQQKGGVDFGQVFKSGAAGAGTGAAITGTGGAIAGSVIPGAGTLAGGGLGALIGGIGGGIAGAGGNLLKQLGIHF